jgi:hypothetical protein
MDGGRGGRHGDGGQPGGYAAGEVGRDLSLREKMADGALVGRLVGTPARSVRVVVLGQRAEPGIVSQAGQRVQAGAADGNRRVQGDERRDQGLADRTRHVHHLSRCLWDSAEAIHVDRFCAGVNGDPGVD